MVFLLHKSVAVAALAAVVCCLGMSGCGTPGAPQPPSLKLPEPVVNLTAVRAGNDVTLHWTMPRKTTDHLLLASQIHGPVAVRVCRREKPSGDCVTAGETAFAPGVAGEFHEMLPAALTSGEARQLLYFVELKNKPGRSAGLSNSAVVASGMVPAAITGLRAEVRADGVALHWNGNGQSDAVRLHRRLLTPAAPKEKKTESGLQKTPAEPVVRDLLVDAARPGQEAGALDSTARFGEVYEYTAQRVEHVPAEGKTLALDGEISAPVRVDVIDTFPPAVPSGLEAVLVSEEKTIDLSWQPDTEEDLAGYVVYRAEASGDWKRISPAPPVATPAYRDSTVEPGHRYRYAVSAIDLTGHESKRSAEAEEPVPEQEK